MHLIEHLKTAKKVLDIGTGSGFITAAMATACPDDCEVFAIDHIQEINDFAKSNIKKVCPNLIKSNKIKFLTMDGRKGIPELEGKPLFFDVIHVGGQLTEIDEQEFCIEA